MLLLLIIFREKHILHKMLGFLVEGFQLLIEPLLVACPSLNQYEVVFRIEPLAFVGKVDLLAEEFLYSAIGVIVEKF